MKRSWALGYLILFGIGIAVARHRVSRRNEPGVERDARMRWEDEGGSPQRTPMPTSRLTPDYTK